MPVNKVDLSLDEIIKANKSQNSDKGKGKAGKGRKTSQGINRRQISKKLTKNRMNKGKLGKNSVKARRGPIAKQSKANTIATKRLVQNLVKKALAQNNITRNRTIAAPKVIQRGKIRGGRILKKTVVVNRLKLNPRSKVIARRRIVPQKVVTVRRQPIQYQQTYVVEQPIRRVNYIQRKPIAVRPKPRTIQVIEQRQQAGPSFRRLGGFNNSRPSIRQHISQLRQVNYVASPRVQVVRQRPFRQQQVRVIHQNQFVQAPPPRKNNNFRQRRNNNFQNRQQQANFDPFYEPPNFLQRIPAQNAFARGRFAQN